MLLDTFGNASGLRTNFLKCSASPIRCGDNHRATIGASLSCPLAEFPIKYLGLRLSTRKVPASTLLPFVDKLTMKLATWKASLLS